MIEDGSLYCRFCGQPLARRAREQTRVPKNIRKLADGTISGQVTIKGTRIRIHAVSESDFRAQMEGYRRGYIPLPSSCGKMTVSDAVADYAEGRKNRHKPTTDANYEYIREKRFTELMKMNVFEVTEADLDAAVERELGLPSRRGGTLSPKTVIDAYHLVISAIKKQRPDFKPDVALPDMPRQFPVILPIDVIVPIIADTDMELPCLLALQYAMSASEIRGLTKSKSVRDGKLYIVETVTRVGGADVWNDSDKEPDRARVFDITPRIQSLIDSVSGDVIEPRTQRILNYRFQKLLEKAGLPKMSFHKLRHVSASVMAEERIPANIIQERGGWKTDDTLKNVYLHTFSDARKEADEKVNSRIEKAYENSRITQEDP